jgi:hypothetical protein
MDSFAFNIFLTLIFTCNIFSFEENYYLQLIGLPMGCICGPAIANLYIYILEQKWLNLNPDKIYFRFIDDIFIASPTPLDLNDLRSYFLYLVLNIEQGKIVIFLDLRISFDSILGKFIFSLYIKPTNTFSYLLPTSNHPKHIFRNIPVSLFKRIRRICSSFLDYLHFSRILFVQLLKRGYNYKTLNNIILNIGNIKRESLLPYKVEDNNFLNNNSIELFYEYDLSYNFFKNSLFKCTETLKLKYPIFEQKKLRLINLMKQNLGSIFLHNFKFRNSFKKYFFKKCNNLNCKICSFGYNFYFLKNDKFILPIKSNSDCNSKYFVYIIHCNKCNVFYVGESGRLVKDRISDHIRNIKKFGKNLSKSLIDFDKQSEIAKHFNLNGHDINIHFRFFIFEKDLINSEIRKSIETDLINIFKNLNITILNDPLKQPKINNIKYLTFQNFT